MHRSTTNQGSLYNCQNNVDSAPDDCCPALSVTWHATLLAKRSANSCCYTPRNSASEMRKVRGDVSQWNSL